MDLLEARAGLKKVDNPMENLESNSKIISIHSSNELIAPLPQKSTSTSLNSIYQVDDFFTTLFHQNKHIGLNSQEFKQLQMQLSEVIRLGQDKFEIVNTISPMELAETFLVGFYGMVDRVESVQRNDFFELWMKTNKRILKP